MKDRIEGKHVLRHASCLTLRRTYFTSSQWSHVRKKKKEATVKTPKFLLRLQGSYNAFPEAIVSTEEFRRNSWWQNDLEQPKGWLSELWKWGSKPERKSVAVLLNILIYFSQRSKENPSQRSLPSSTFIAFYVFNSWRPHSWVAGFTELE